MQGFVLPTFTIYTKNHNQYLANSYITNVHILYLLWRRMLHMSHQWCGDRKFREIFVMLTLGLQNIWHFFCAHLWVIVDVISSVHIFCFPFVVGQMSILWKPFPVSQWSTTWLEPLTSKHGLNNYFLWWFFSIYIFPCYTSFNVLL